MTDYRNEEINPEDYWPEAEKLLDTHFQKKKKRRALFLLFLLLLIGAGGLTLWESANHKNSVQVPPSATSVNSSAIQHSSVEKPALPSVNTTVHESASVTPPDHVNSESDHQTKNKKHNKQIKNIAATAVIIGGSKQKTIPIQNSNSYHKEESEVAVIENTGNLKSSNEKSSTEINQEVSGRTAEILFAPILPLNFHDNSIPSTAIGIPDSPLKKKSRLDLIAYLGAESVKKNSTIPPSRIDLTRRANEESNAILPYGGIQLSYGKGHWDFRAGLELNVQGEKVNYSPYTTGDYDSTYNAWEYSQTSITDVDSMYIMGILFTNSHVVIVADSAYVSKTDTLNGNHYDPSLLEANGTNRFYFVEIPIEVAYTRTVNRWGIGVSAGLSPGYLVAAEGSYLKPDQSGSAPLNTSSYNRFILSGRAGIEFSYLVSSKIKILLRPCAKINLTSLKDESGAEFKYNSLGVNAGVCYSFR